MRCLFQATALILLYICGFISGQMVEYSGDGEGATTTVLPITDDEDLTSYPSFGADYEDLLVVLLNSRRSFFKEAIVNQTLSGVDCITKEKAIEIIFVIDGSFSLSTNQLVKNFVLESLRVFELDFDKTKVGILRMTGDSVETILSLQAGIHHSLVQFSLNQYSNDGGLKQSFNPVKIPDVLSSNTDNQPHKVAILIKFGGRGPFKLNKTELNNMGYKIILVNIDTNELKDMADKHINIKNPVGLPFASSDLDNYFRQTFLCDSCIPSPCERSSKCISSKNSTAYTCICIPGFVGPPCVPADPCSGNPCPPPRICQTSGGNFSCVCPPNTTPPQCTAPCDAKPCKNGGTCVPNGNSFQCSCMEGFYGTLCEQNLCANIRCFYGQCVVRKGKAVCNCLTGYSGPECKDGGPCANFNCLNGGKCAINNGAPKCDCPAPFFGSVCELNPCSNYDCQNGGTCYLYLGQPRCNCPSTYSGVKCENGPCLYYYKCQNGGTCEIRNGQPACKCQPNYYGADCSINLCAGIKCVNGGKCKIDPQQSNFLTCICPAGFSGPTCADSAPCTNAYCLNGGTCSFEGNRAICACASGYYGPRCGTADPCNGYACGNGGVCRVQTNLLPICQCQDGRTAATCGGGQRSSPCMQKPCRNGCMCVQSCKHEGGFYCRSTNGYLGKTCSIPPPTVLCEANAIRISINDALIQEVSANLPTIYLYASPNINEINNPICKVYQPPYSFAFNIPFDQCGASNNVQLNGDVVVSNTIWLNRQNNGAFTMPVPVATFKCTYSKDLSIVTSIRPTMATIPSITKTSSSGIQGTVELCKTTSGCPNSCPADKTMKAGAVYTVGEMMHMIIRTPSSVAAKVLSVDSLYLSCDPSLNAISTKDFQLASKGCPVTTWDVDLSYNAKQPNSLCASFRVPQLLACQSVVYVHAKLSTCLSTSTITCATSSRSCPTITRRKRTASNASDEVVNVFGPIYIISSSKGRENLEMFPEVTLAGDRSNPLEDFPSRFQKALVIAISTITVIFVVIIVCYLVLYFRRNSKS